MEYAAGGTLAEYIASTRLHSTHLSEFEVLEKLTQICLGLEYIHSKNILHRDLKTQNILLCHNQKIAKIGDFGISKVLTSKSKANTVVGSPSYLSPELCSAKPYNQMSDVWALGCVLYEMMALKRAFDAPSLPQLIQLIVSGKFDPIPPKIYSSQLLFLVRCLLHVDPNKRPTPSDLLQKPILMKHVIQLHLQIGCLPCNGGVNEKKRQETTRKPVAKYFSLVTEEEAYLPLTKGMTLSQLALGLYSLYGITTNNSLVEWIWSTDTEEEDEAGRFSCLPIETDGDVIDVAAGEDFFMLIDQNKAVYSGGSNTLGCLGHGNTCTSQKEPALVQNLFGWEVVKVACGNQHTVILTSENEVFTWGLGYDGRLGQGSKDNQFAPNKVILSGELVVQDIVAGPDCSAIITAANELFCCGKNMSNKLLLSLSYESSQQNTHLTFTKAELPNTLQIDKIVYSHCHAVLLSAGQVFTAGSNEELQLGRETIDDISTTLELLPSPEPVLDIAITNRSTLTLTQRKSVLQFGNRSLQPRVVMESGQTFQPFEVKGVGQKFVVLGFTS
ncbi:serine/threonine-protein kinase Nek8-like isoform X2 [Bolinopsis microptera]